MPSQFREYVIRPTLKHLGVYTEAVEELLFATVAHESLGGRLLHQQRGNAVGAYQIEPTTHQDLWQNFIPSDQNLYAKIRQLTNRPANDDELITNLTYATAIAYCVYARAKDVMPTDKNDLWAIASYWKMYYNTYMGAGTLQRFVDDYYRWR